MRLSRDLAIASWFALTIFVSAFLLFQVQPVISKAILPWFGGSPAVWSTCLLFFQVLLLGGYGYAHGMIGLKQRPWQFPAHCALLGLAILLLPITPGAHWKPADGGQPTARILALLLANVGLPYFLLAATGPLLSAWFARVFAGRSPYRLYALSNVGSLAALLTYPFLFEPNLSIWGQGLAWSAAFVLFALLCGGLALFLWQTGRQEDFDAAASQPQPESQPQPQPQPDSERPGPITRGSWIFLAALASVALLAVTNHVCQDVAVVPFMWVVPLSVYLLSFIICFDRELWYARWLFGPLTIFSIVLLLSLESATDVDLFLQEWHIPWRLSNVAERTIRLLVPGFALSDWEDEIVVQCVVYFGALFCICMTCHGEIVRTRPGAKWLTEFYLLIAAGGALGGMFVALFCPQAFTSAAELPLALAGGVLMAGLALVRMWAPPLPWWLRCLGWSAAAAALALTAVLANGRTEENVVAQARNFYGILSVREFNPDIESIHGRALYHGRIMHGYQYLDPSRRDEATTYYNDGSGVGLAVRRHPGQADGLRIGVIGLGAGTMAAHGRPGDVIRFYEIDAGVVALTDRYFTYRSRAEARNAKIEIVLGDARVSMERELAEHRPQAYDVIVLDAFSGDAIPIHLLTVESLELYRQHLRAGGIIAVHVSNRFLSLEPVVYALAKQADLEAIEINYPEGPGSGDAASDWILLTNNREFLDDAEISGNDYRNVAPPERLVLWTDQRSNLYEVLKNKPDFSRWLPRAWGGK